MPQSPPPAPRHRSRLARLAQVWVVVILLGVPASVGVLGVRYVWQNGEPLELSYYRWRFFGGAFSPRLIPRLVADWRGRPLADFLAQYPGLLQNGVDYPADSYRGESTAGTIERYGPGTAVYWQIGPANAWGRCVIIQHGYIQYTTLVKG